MSAVVVVDYDPSWPTTFEVLRKAVWNAVENHALRIEHVGSTSVSGLAAKPVIDMTVVVPSRNEVPAVRDALLSLGYRYLGELGITGRDAFLNPQGMSRHNLYACVEGILPLRNHLAVRECLRQDSAAAHEHGLLKKQLARQFPTDVSAYCAAKSDFLESILARAGFTDDELATIWSQNISS